MASPFSFLVFIAFSSLLVNFSYCFNPKLINASLAGGGFSDGFATWYGPRNGDGSDSGACGFRNTISQPPINSLIAAGGSADLFKKGEVCGACFQVACSSHPACSGNPVTIIITDECPGDCGGHPYNHFDLSGTAFGALAKSGQADTLRNAGQLNIGFKRVPCNWNSKISFYIDTGSNPYYLAFVTEYVNGDGDLGSIEIQPAGSGWIGMEHSWGAVWKANFPNGAKGPFSVRITTATSRRQIVASNVIPANWSPGNTYWSNVNF